MGMYTELRVNCALKYETPMQVVRVLQYLADGDTMNPPTFELPAHQFFECQRWTGVMRMSSAYFDAPSSAVVRWHGLWRVLSVANIKNYDGEIEHFIDWLRPHVYGDPGTIWAQHRYEEFDDATDVAT